MEISFKGPVMPIDPYSRFTLWQRTDYNSDMCFSHRILDMPFCMLAAKDKENDERVFN